MTSLATAKRADGLNLDGAGVVAWTRNQLIHPKAGKIDGGHEKLALAQSP
jgi:hypothetical protein